MERNRYADLLRVVAIGGVGCPLPVNRDIRPDLGGESDQSAGSGDYLTLARRRPCAGRVSGPAQR